MQPVATNRRAVVPARRPLAAFSQLIVLGALCLVVVLACVAPLAAQPAQPETPLPSPLEVLAGNGTPAYDAQVSQLVDDQTQRVTSNGLTFELPAQAARFVRAGIGNSQEMWVLDCADAGRLVVMTQKSPWSGFEADLLAHVTAGVESYAAAQAADTPGTPRTTPATSAVSGSGVPYVRAGLAAQDLMLIVAAVPLPTGNAATIALMCDGVATPQVTAYMAAALNSIDVAPTPYYEVVDLLGLDSATIVQTLEDAGFVYAEQGQTRGWTAQTQGAAGIDDCLVQLVAFDAEQDAGNTFVSRAAALDGAKLSGVQVEWVGTPVEWDEALDVPPLLESFCNLGGMLGGSYVYGWDENGAYVYVHAGSCQVRLEDAYWLVTLQMDPATGYYSTTLSADLLRNGFGAGFTDYDDLLQTVLEEW